MTVEEFVNAISLVVRDAAVTDTLENINAPPVAPEHDELAVLSKWYRSLQEVDQKRIAHIIGYAVDQSVFGFLCVLDGVRPLQKQATGQLELFYIEGDHKVPLNDMKGTFLHDLFEPKL